MPIPPLIRGGERKEKRGGEVMRGGISKGDEGTKGREGKRR
jgi:hypothetical protein